ncbi:senescence-associated carboxylesterase 101 [Dorcoceras hygrometricum]|uniref:Senescence-associated carboxylesterase 101 n=1 Tax=Dorcoceras hygrometricum TaxID=472368 RepID=A0A2Z7AZ01_9LAMI|nr:senescence-associated carboxylesterase 101 [Dorcoceras hygrometricum]
MASAFITYSYQINFDSVLAIPDHDGMLNMFKELEASGLRGFLGCQSVLYEKELGQFFDTTLVQDGDITGAVSGKFFSVSQARFVEIFELPTEGLVDFSDVPKNLVFDARSIFSKSVEKEPVKDTGEIAEKHTDEIDDIIGQIIAETSKMGSDEKDQEEQRVDETDIGDDFDQWLEESFKDFVVHETGTVVEAERSKNPVVEKDMDKAVGSKNTEEEHMSIDDLLLQISDDMMLPYVTAAEITKILLGESININELQERDWYYSSLPRISMHDKWKEPLDEDEPVKGNPVRETVALICGDVDFLVQLRDKVMQDVVEFFHSFSLNKLSDLDVLKDLKDKERLMLGWAEVNSQEMAVKRRMYILAKYREMLLRKLLDSRRRYFAPGQPWTAMAAQIIDMLSAAHSKSLKDLQAKQQEHGIEMIQPSSSLFVIDSGAGCGAVLAQFYSMAKSTCWVRPLILVDGFWTPLQGNDYWMSSCRLSLFVNRKPVPESLIDTDFVPHGLFIEPVQYWGASPSLIKTWGWARVCTEIFRYSMFGCLRPKKGPSGSRQTSWSYDICEKLDLTDISTSWLATSWKWSKAGASKQLEEQERKAQAQLQTKSGADAEVAPEDQLEDENKEAGDEKERALQELMKQPA